MTTTTKTKTRTRELLHPVLAIPAIATDAGFWQRNGRTAGIVLQFCDGHRASMTFAEIQQAEQAAETAVEEVKL